MKAKRGQSWTCTNVRCLDGILDRIQRGLLGYHGDTIGQAMRMSSVRAIARNESFI